MIYDKIAANYDRLFERAERWFLSDWRAETLSYLPQNSSILEIGAGTGLNFRHYPEFNKAIASEISIEMIQFAKTKSQSIEIIQADAEILPFYENSFDAAFATLVFCSLSRPESGFEELIRVVKPNGRIVLLEHVRPNGIIGYFFDVINFFTIRIIQDCFNRKTASIAKHCGLTIIEIVPKAFGIVNLIVCKNEK
jgi:ubiquinone/menaquinone biosynthesis C-methylase UbiE